METMMAEMMDLRKAVMMDDSMVVMKDFSYFVLDLETKVAKMVAMMAVMMVA